MRRTLGWLWLCLLVAALSACSSTTDSGSETAGVSVEGTEDGGEEPNGDDLCGNGTVDEGEICDIAIPVPQEGCCAFPEFCVDGDPCTVDKLVNDGTCLADCDFSEEVAPSGKVQDQCCPTGATAATDADCDDACGNGVVDEGESCDPGLAESCPTACEDDGDPCTTQSLVTADPCNPECVTTNIIEQISGDGCCPDGATMAQDSDCPPDMTGPVCGDGVVDDGETCDTAITSGEGACPGAPDCDDGDACTVDVVNGAGTCTASCGTDGQPGAGAADGCCPDGANANTDPDCSASCGNGVQEANEECDDGNTDDGDGCSANCTVELSPPAPITKDLFVGCAILGLIFADVPITVTATPTTPIVAGQPFTVNVEADAFLNEFLSGTIASLVGPMVDVTGADINFQASAGATGAVQGISPTVPFTIDVTVDPDMNGQAGPTPIPAGDGPITFTADAGATDVTIGLAGVVLSVDVLGGTTLECPAGTWSPTDPPNDMGLGAEPLIPPTLGDQITFQTQ